MTPHETMKRLRLEGHNHHCASAQAHGYAGPEDCVCTDLGKPASPYHTMNPPPGGWPRPPRRLPLSVGEYVRKLLKAVGLNRNEAAQHMGLTPSELSALLMGDVLQAPKWSAPEAALEKARALVLEDDSKSWEWRHKALLLAACSSQGQAERAASPELVSYWAGKWAEACRWASGEATDG